MSTLDLSRLLNQPQKHYVGGRLQQGRILTDADFNEAATYSGEDQRRAVNEWFGEGFIGTGASPDDGFSLGIPIDTLPTVPVQTESLDPTELIEPAIFEIAGVPVAVRPVSLRAGTFYLGGMRLELERPEPFMFQRDFLQMKPDDIPLFDRALTVAGMSQLYYLEAWEQVVTPVEDHEFLETALSGRDTSGRVRRMRRVRAFWVQGVQPESCEELWPHLVAQLENERNGVYDPTTGAIVPNARLQIGFEETVDSKDCAECSPEQGGRFLGADNQALRILITREGRFVWSLDNAAPLYRVRVTGLASDDPNTDIEVTLLSPLKDGAHAPLIGRVVELIPFSAVLEGRQLPGPNIDPHYNKVADEVGAFSRVIESFDPNTRSFKLQRVPEAVDAIRAFVHMWDPKHPANAELFVPGQRDAEPPDERHFYMRLWHQAEDESEIELVVETAASTPLRDTTILPNFVVPGRRGDSWTIALRPEMPEQTVAFSYTQPAGVPPDGPRHFYAPLALLRYENHVVVENDDCRPILRPLTDVDCVTYTVGDDRLTRGEFTSIQEAIDSLPEEGGTVLVRPGLYRESVVIHDRTNIALVGCGETTILQSVDGGNEQGIIRITGASSNIRVSGFAVQVVEEHVVFIGEESSGISVTDLSVDVGEFASGHFTLGVSPSNAVLFRADQASQLVFGGLRLRPTRRPAFSLSNCDGLLIEDVDSRGADDEVAAELPVIELVACHSGVLRDVNLVTHGQPGIRLSGTENSDIEIVRLSGDFRPNVKIVDFSNVEATTTRLARLRQPKPALDVEGGARIQLRQARVRMIGDALPWVGKHALVVVGGTDLEIEGSHIEALDNFTVNAPIAWGGVQIRGNSSRVVVRGNNIIGGVGHGVTLGSVLWNPVGGGAQLRQGAGENQMHVLNNQVVIDGVIQNIVHLGVDYNAVDEGPLTDIAIVDNRIENFASNGISSLTLFGLGFLGSTDFIEITRLRVEGNRIRGNVRFPSPTSFYYVPLVLNAKFAVRNAEFLAHTQVLPYGGIILGHVDHGDIRGNVIADNGTSTRVPSNGILVASAESLAICQNVISGNGGRHTPNPSDVPLIGTRAGIAVLLAGTGTPPNEIQMFNVFNLGGNSLPSDGLSVRIANNSVRQPEGRALYVVAAGPVQVDGNFFSSEGFHGREDAGQDAFAIGDVVFIQNVGGPWERFNIANVDHTLPTSDTTYGGFEDFNTSRDAAVYLFNARPRSPRNFVGLGGQTMFQNNQIVYDWQVNRTPQPQNPLATFAVAIMGLDHTAVGSNQFAMRLITPSGFVPKPATAEMGTNEVFYSHLFVTGCTVEVTSNRIAENADTARFSALGLGELALTMAHNQGMHEIYGVATGNAPRDLIENQWMLGKRGSNFGNTAWIYNEGLRIFMQLLNRPLVLSSTIPQPPGG